MKKNAGLKKEIRVGISGEKRNIGRMRSELTHYLGAEKGLRVPPHT